MTRRELMLGGLAALATATSVRAQDPASKLVRVRMTTGLGAIVLDLEAEKAPLTTANFLRYVDQKKLDKNSFYRAMPNGKGVNGETTGLVQGGDSRRALPPVKHEPTSLTGLSHTDGTISMARGAPGTARTDFFICIGGMTFLDAGRTGTSDGLGFAAFGHVVEGMDVVNAILTAPVSATEGNGAMRGQMLSPRVPILTTRRA